MKWLMQLCLAALVIVIVVVFLAVTLIDQNQQGLLVKADQVILDSGKPVILNPGLHWIWPGKYTAFIFDVRPRILVQENQFTTADKQTLNVSVWTIWNVSDLAKFYQVSQGNDATLNKQLQTFINNELSRSINDEALANVTTDAQSRNLLLAGKAFAKENGITIQAVEISSLSLTGDSLNNAYAQMTQKENSLADKLQIEGLARVDMLQIDASNQVQAILAQAENQANMIRAEGDSAALAIYSAANDAEPKFYKFYRSLQAYKAVFSNPHSVLILQPRGEFFKYFNSPNGEESR